jgi:hypothetical protein
MKITHKTWFFPENLKGTRRYYEIMRAIIPIFSGMISYPKKDNILHRKYSCPMEGKELGR